jgi:hypothetical protein
MAGGVRVDQLGCAAAPSHRDWHSLKRDEPREQPPLRLEVEGKQLMRRGTGEAHLITEGGEGGEAGAWGEGGEEGVSWLR